MKKYSFNQLHDSVSSIYPKLCEADQAYFGSLSPCQKILNQTRHINFKISKQKGNRQHLQHYTTTNIHLFKPHFQWKLQNSELDCFVGSEDIMHQTIRGILMISRYLILQDITYSIQKIDMPTEGLIQNWKIHSLVLICRIQSFLGFLLIQ